MQFYEWLRRIFVSDINYTTQVSELINYWIINIGLLYLAYKTYKNSFKKEAVLIAQLAYYEDFNSDNLYLEIYNHGNDVAQNVVLGCYNSDLIDTNNSIFNNDLGFIKPNTSKKIHVGYSLMGKISFFGKEFTKEELLKKEIRLNVKYNKTEIKDFIINTSFLSSLSSVYISRQDPVKESSKSLKEMSQTLKEINKKIKKD